MSDQSSSEISIAAGMTIPALPKSGFPTREQGEILLALARAFVNSSIVHGDADAFIISKRKVIFQIKKASGTSQSITVGRFRVKSLAGDYYTCRSLSGYVAADFVEGPSDILVARPPEHRNSLVSSTLVDGAQSLSVSYAYTSATQRVQTVTSSGTYNTETHIIIPHFVLNQPINGAANQYSEIWAIQTGSKTGVKVLGVEIDWQDLNVAARRWVQVPNGPPIP